MKLLLNQGQRQKGLTWAKEKNNWSILCGAKSSEKSHLDIKVPESGGRVDAQNPSSSKATMKFLQPAVI